MIKNAENLRKKVAPKSERTRKGVKKLEQELKNTSLTDNKRNKLIEKLDNLKDDAVELERITTKAYD